MENIQFKVKVPALLEVFVGLKSKLFSDGNSQENKDAALKYLSEVIIRSVEIGSIQIFDFTDNSATLERVNCLKVKPYINDNGLLNFPKLFQCKIKYRYSDNFVFQLLKSKIKNKEINNFLESLGSVQLSLYLENNHSEVNLMSFDNQTNYKSYSNLKKVFKRIGIDSILNQDEFFQQYDFNLKLKKRMNLDLFHSNNFYNKAILEKPYFFELESVFLSMMNNLSTINYIYVFKEQVSNTEEILQRLIQTYKTNVRIKIKKQISYQAKRYILFELHKKGKNQTYSKFIYNHKGQLFYRNLEGIVKVDDQTSIENLAQVPLDKDLKEFMEVVKN
ncbi:hypothetical protein [Riemerella anatipestifer]|uniref:hypothetical protein n=1 Tax=Riemerella anatipestifer TaxID=34085 RepID=UPI00129DAD65|nr:hypothetical protein [Riemerella anatipestifer]MBT0550462.1 hypothetical protein [Riemerella anatipestifer]MBT0553427.1 hypothetical protein [Riemerella anatipestifer]MCE3023429.1 hypothetical protein [Riemerella anatipestifer]MCU7542363.1 hypothetical protein [Riemerella anatipestifer]MCU7559235.1 hypothetical protein [Riemerella anatipestifer]